MMSYSNNPVLGSVTVCLNSNNVMIKYVFKKSTNDNGEYVLKLITCIKIRELLFYQLKSSFQILLVSNKLLFDIFLD